MVIIYLTNSFSKNWIFSNKSGYFTRWVGPIPRHLFQEQNEVRRGATAGFVINIVGFLLSPPPLVSLGGGESEWWPYYHQLSIVSPAQAGQTAPWSGR